MPSNSASPSHPRSNNSTGRSNGPTASNGPVGSNNRRRSGGNRSRSGASRPRNAAPSRPSNSAGGGSALEAQLAASTRLADPEVATFAELGLPERVLAVLSERGITRPSPIQARSIPDALAGKDVLGRAQTGSGKTLAFGLPLVARLDAMPGTRTRNSPRGLVLVPTRELAHQVADSIGPVGEAFGLRTVVVVGGSSMSRQISELGRGADIVVATPGRLIDLMERRSVELDQVAIAVLDEADHMADLGFLPAVTRILDATPTSRQCLLFSATLDRGVDRLATRYLDQPRVHAVDSAASSVTNMEHHVFRVAHEDKVSVAAEVGSRPARTLFFVRTKHGADRLAKQLRTRGVEAGAIHGNLNQNQRLRALDAFTSGRARVLVATDVAARGIHVDDVDLVVHFDPPNDHKDYLHRSGRTARAGASGTVIAFVEPAQASDVAKMHAAASVRARTVSVTPGHPAVREIALSGEPIVVTAEQPPVSPAPASGGSARPGPQRGRGRPRHSGSRNAASRSSGSRGDGPRGAASRGAASRGAASRGAASRGDGSRGSGPRHPRRVAR